jgi:hypothetical protein
METSLKTQLSTAREADSASGHVGSLESDLEKEAHELG